MKVLLDTSVLVPAFVKGHALHGAANACYRKARRNDGNLHVASHSLAETFAVLTRFPTRPRISPNVARRLVRENVVAVARLVDLGRKDYAAAIERMAHNDLTGGAISDALIIQAAIKSGVDRLITFNGADFRRVWPDAGKRLEVLG